MENVNKFFDSILGDVKNNKKVVLVSGASSSGKSYTSNLMCDYFNSNGTKTFLFSADNYYKGIARTIVEKALINNKYSKETLLKFKEIYKIVRKHTINSLFPVKMCDENVNKIKQDLYNIFDKTLADDLAKNIKIEFERINFDEPFAVDLKSLANDINKICNGKEIIVPDYSFKTGEIEYYEKNKVNPNNYDCIIIEGIYALRDEVLENIDKSKIVPARIDCDLKTLISRKLDRDITKGRSTLTKELIISSFLTQVMPSFFKYIYPSLKNAKYCYSTSLTDEEVKDRQVSKQKKFCANSAVYEYLTDNATFKGIEYQKDYFLEDKYYQANKDIVLRIREVDGKVKNLTIKTNDDIKKLNRNVEEYSFSGFDDKNTQIASVLKNFIDSGFYFSNIVEKTRQIYEYKGSIIKVDNVDGEIYLEVDEKQNNGNLKLKPYTPFSIEQNGDDLNRYLVSEVNNSYYQMKKEKDLENKVHNECELKLKVNENIKNFVKQHGNIKNCKFISQKYLDLQNEEAVKFIKSFLRDNVDTTMFKEARIRKINNKKCYLTLKSAGNLERFEYEREIPLCLSENINKNLVKGLINKKRYDIMLSKDIVMSVDIYLDRKLYVVEVEFDKQKYSRQQILNKLQKVLSGCQIEDITENLSYKNSNLAIS